MGVSALKKKSQQTKPAEKLEARIGRDHLVTGIETLIMRISPADADHLLTACHYDRQRPVRAWWVSALAETMRRSEFYEGTQLKFAEVAGRDDWVLLDGQHRLKAVVEANVTAAFTVTVCKVRSIDDAWKLYYTTDTGVARSIADTYPDLADVLGTRSSSYCGAAASAALLLAGHFTRKGGEDWAYQIKSKEFRLRVVRQWARDIRSFFEVVHTTPSRDMAVAKACVRTPIVAVAAATFHWQADRAFTFWTTVIENGAMDRNDPRRALAHQITQQRGQSVSGLSFARFVASCWGYAWTGATLGPNVTPLSYDATRPIEIVGTPYRRHPRVGGLPPLAIVPTDLEFNTHTVEPVRTLADAQARVPMAMGVEPTAGVERAS